MPAPAFVSEFAVVPLLIPPPTVSVFAVMVTVRLVPAAVPSETAPVPRFRLLVPVKEKLPFQFCALLFVLIRFGAALSSLPPLIVSGPVLRAVLVARLSVPEVTMVPPS